MATPRAAAARGEVGEALPALPCLAPSHRLVRLPGKIVPALLPLLDGRRTVDELVEVFGDAARPAVENALVALRPLLTDGPVTWPEPRPVRGCSVAVAGTAPAGLEVARLLRASGVDVEPAAGPVPGVDLTVCVPCADELPLLRTWNERAMEHELPWLQLLPFAVGPLYQPGDTCCYECFRLRWAGHFDPHADDALAAAIAAQLVLGWLVVDDRYAPAAYYAVGAAPAISVHHVYRVPGCPACSEVLVCVAGEIS